MINIKVIFITGIIIIILILGMVMFITPADRIDSKNQNENDNQIIIQEHYDSDEIEQIVEENKKVRVDDPLNASYIVDGYIIPFSEGLYEIDHADSYGVTTYKIIENPVYGDMNGDGIDDAAVIITQKKSEIPDVERYFSALAVEIDEMYYGTNAVLHGNNISLQNQNIENQRLIIKFLDNNILNTVNNSSRNETIKYLKLLDNILVVVEME